MISQMHLTRNERKISKILGRKFVGHQNPEIKWHGQLGQDKIATIIDKYIPTRYFVEFGATDGLTLSNTATLEQEFSWRGILAEPARRWRKDLEANRSSIIDHRCVWKYSDLDLEFREQGELSGVDTYLSSKVGIETYLVKTVTLGRLLSENAAPTRIGLLSVDTEGTELEILSAFDFDKYIFNLITCEHNYRKDRTKIRRILKSNGYLQILVKESVWDDWYIHESVAMHVLEDTLL
jgi:FkbM family methyltransferase